LSRAPLNSVTPGPITVRISAALHLTGIAATGWACVMMIFGVSIMAWFLSLGFRQQQRERLEARCHALLHRSLEHGITRFLRRVLHRHEQRGLARLLDERDGVHRIARVPRLVEPFGGNDARGLLDLAVVATHTHFPVAPFPHEA